MKKKDFKMYSFNNADIVEEITCSGKEKTYKYSITKNERELKIKEARLTENILIKAYCRYTKQDFNDGMLTTDIIKVILSDWDDTARRQVKGIIFNDIEYVAWFSTPSQMKVEDKDTHSKCEWYFIKKELEPFADWFEYIISLGKIEDYYGQEAYINKDIIARIALATSSSFETNLIPNIIILPECSNKVISDVIALIDGVATEITEDSSDELKKYRQVNTTCFDGCGIMSLEFADKIRDEMGLKHQVSFAGIRMYNGLAVKGLVTSVDFIGYFEEFYRNDTDLFYKKEDGKFYCIDYFGQEQCLDDADMILNETQCKWAKNFESMEEVYKLLNSNEFDEYGDLLSHLYITKTNKEPDKLKDYTLTNYQLLSNLAITEREINTLSQETERIFKEILKGNEDVTRLFLGDIITNVETDIEGNIILESDDSITTKAEKLLKLNNAFIDSSYVRRTIARMINKKINLLASGKFYIKGDYKTLTQDPISFLDWIMYRGNNELMNRPINGLEAHNFYCTNINADEVRTISRCPLNSFSEIQNVTFTKNEIMNKYTGHFSKEILVFNCFDLTPQILSGCDFDLDIAFVVDEEIIKNSVVIDLPLVNPMEGDKVPMVYSKENRIEATLLASGNLIGSLAMYGMSVCNHSQQAMYRNYKYIDKDNYKYYGEIYDYRTLWEGYKEKFKDEYKENTYSKFEKMLEESYEYIPDYYTEEQLKEQIKQGFYYCRNYSYELRNLQMLAIDTPKTLNPPKVPEYYKGLKKPRFLYYAKDYIKKGDTENLHTALNLHATRVARELIKEDIQQQKYRDRLDILEKYMSCTEFAGFYKEDYEKCKTEIQNLYDKYKKEVHQSEYNLQMKKAKAEYYKELDDLKERYKKRYVTISAYKRKSSELKDNFDENKEGIKEKYLNIKLLAEADCTFAADRILENYKRELISHSLVMLKCSENFIFNFFFKAVAAVIEKNSMDVENYTHILDENGSIEYLYKKYKRILVKRSSQQTIDKLHEDSREQLFKKLSNQSKNGFTKEVGIGGCKLDKLDFNKVAIKVNSYVDVKTHQERKTIKLFAGDKEVGYVFPDYCKIDDFITLFDYEDKEINFSLKDRNHTRLQAVLNYIG
ncbi:RNA dependent RNA polymerase [Clostridium sp. DJ247]|uniref:RNA dependent RNA polymerase n=1 Tax=Clostridium sp. DJ247 TaxID=2726188 RepID=UPI00162A4DCF|nr:hypothetical protein [Clostridium sp. DJ247]MBC2580847.1 hypothetical protein [Clostridium sp. DJ247]